MKILAAAATLAAIALPAVAQAQNYDDNWSYRSPPPAQYRLGRAPEQAFARQIDRTARRHSPNPAYDVYVNGRYVGSDPDPRVRMMMQFDQASTGDN